MHLTNRELKKSFYLTEDISTDLRASAGSNGTQTLLKEYRNPIRVDKCRSEFRRLFNEPTFTERILLDNLA